MRPMKREPVTIEAGEGKPKPKGRRIDPEFHKQSPHWQAAQRRKAEEAAIRAAAAAAVEAGIASLPEGVTPITPQTAEPVTPATPKAGGVEFSTVVKNQTVGLVELSEAAPDAARYLVKVMRGKAKGEQWKIRAAESILDRVAVTGGTVERAQIAAQAASGAAADLGAMLARLVEARALQVKNTPKTGQTSGKPPTE